MAIKPERKITYEDYRHFPDGERWEVIDGEGFVCPSPTTRHQDVAGELYLLIKLHLKRHGGGRVFIAPLDVVLGQHDIVQPDVVFVADEHAHVLTEANVRGRPTWLVEVLSSDVARDRRLKLQRYEHFGVAEYWIVDPVGAAVEIYRLEDGVYGPPRTVRPPDAASPLALPDLRINLSTLFAA